ncbi:ArpU family transcriptional regulator [Paenalkalicoccus suaedae]|uniref:ArpU family transcriptional regulator n=1 Tax=Paenalkalicoccus suaedae TaxID=2592382 RepID=A0A859FGY3_9BACI|nr:ArpU family phage packaging/lysis transcriptional regulator [Paenalkalicoccus suaedae]QKS71922.1 ArpU family transcriptional regulator [Paenalkalicoccus suaedae]
MKTMDFPLADINKKETKKKVERKLKKLYFHFRTTRSMPSVTTSYSLAPNGPSNQFSSKVEKAAIANVEQEQKLIAQEEEIQEITECINLLSSIEREVIYKEYFEDEYVFNYEIYNSMGISETKYYEIKSSAFYTLAFMLKIQVYNGEGVNA